MVQTSQLNEAQNFSEHNVIGSTYFVKMITPPTLYSFYHGKDTLVDYKVPLLVSKKLAKKGDFFWTGNQYMAYHKANFDIMEFPWKSSKYKKCIPPYEIPQNIINDIKNGILKDGTKIVL